VKKPQPTAPNSPRKRRTREHIIADLSMNFVERHIFENGDTAIRPTADYGYDLILETYDAEGYPEPDLAYMQLKATDDMQRHERDDSYWLQVDMRDCRRWIETVYPDFLILYDAIAKRAFWLHVQGYSREHPLKHALAGSVRVDIPKKNRFGSGTMQAMRKIKAEISRQFKEREDLP
jgi:hypothetical protein